MTNSAVVEDGIVVNIIAGVVDGLIPVPDGVSAYIGGAWDGVNFHPIPVPIQTPEEIAAEELEADDSQMAAAARLGSLDRAILQYLFGVENRLRVLEGGSPITAPQFTSAVRAKLRG